MDTDTLIKTARARFALQASKHHLQEKYSAQLTIPYSGGMWKITPELLAVLSSSDSIILTDVYNTPILVNSQEFLPLAKEHYEKVMGEWLNEYQTLTKLR